MSVSPISSAGRLVAATIASRRRHAQLHPARQLDVLARAEGVAGLDAGVGGEHERAPAAIIFGKFCAICSRARRRSAAAARSCGASGRRSMVARIVAITDGGMRLLEERIGVADLDRIAQRR